MSYKEAILTLYSPVATAQQPGQNQSQASRNHVLNNINYLQRVGLTVEDVDNLNVIHVTGTKGKGSTCAFVESILRQYGYKTGMFSSPHLIEVRERICINGRPISKELFAKSFWEVFEKLVVTKAENNGAMPFFYSFTTVMAFYIFVREKVDVAILEVLMGGEYDNTNVVQKPVVCGISSLDYDHVNVLGHTLEEIAWNKAGILKKGAPAFTVPQPESCLSVVLSRAKERGCPLYVAPPLTKEELSASGLQLGIAGDRQRYNAALAVQLCRVWLDQHNKSFQERALGCEDQSGVQDVSSIPQKPSTQLSREMVQGLTECRWPGRTQTIARPGVTYYLDGAHTAGSIQHCVEWFQQAADEEKELKGRVSRALVFNMTGERPVSELLKLLKGCGFNMAAFCPNDVSTIASENVIDQIDPVLDLETKMNKCAQNCHFWEDLLAGEDSQSSCAILTPADATPGTPSSTEHVNGHAPTDSTSSELAEETTNAKNIPAVKFEEDASETTPEAVSSPACQSAEFPCIASALRWATQNQDESFLSAVSFSDEELNGTSSEDAADVPHIQVLVTGSLHLVGGVLQLLTPGMNE